MACLVDVLQYIPESLSLLLMIVGRAEELGNLAFEEFEGWRQQSAGYKWNGDLGSHLAGVQRVLSFCVQYWVLPQQQTF